MLPLLLWEVLGVGGIRVPSDAMCLNRADVQLTSDPHRDAQLPWSRRQRTRGFPRPLPGRPRDKRVSLPTHGSQGASFPGHQLLPGPGSWILTVVRSKALALPKLPATQSGISAAW